MKSLKKHVATLILTLPCAVVSLPGMAHTPLFDCFDEDGGKIVCEAGFSDGASAEGIEIRVLNAQGRVLAQDKIGEDASVTFERPEEEFSVVFSAGEGHTITVIGDDIY